MKTCSKCGQIGVPISTCAQWGIKKRTPLNLTIAVLYLKLR